jgi:enediyne biosynthesis protein E4
LLRNNGDGTFPDVTKEAGMWQPDGRGMSISAADFNNDGFLDIVVANDAMETHFFENTGKGTFVEKALQLGVAFGENGQGVSSMGPFPGDVNRDGLIDYFVPNLNYNILYINIGRKGFLDKTAETGVSQMIGQYAGWAGLLFDYDNDGWLDIFVTHGNAHHEYVQEDSLLRNKGDGTFADVSPESGKYFFEKYVGRGAAWGDLDNDGDVDLVLNNLNDDARILRNDGGNRNRWLIVEPRLRFATGERAAIGARVVVTTGNLKQVEDVNPVRGYMSQGDHRLHFGLKDAERADVEIRWPGGKVERFSGVRANQIVRYTQDAGGGK